MAELIFYTNPMSRGRIARWMLEEIGAPYETNYLTYGGTMKAAEYLAINPMGKVPAIVHKGQTVTECAAICAYLADAFPEKNLAPAPTERAAYYRWMFFAAGPLESAVTNRAMGFEPSSEQTMMAGYGNYDQAVSTLVKALSETDFVCGKQFTAADVYLGSQVTWGVQFGTLPKEPVFVAYQERVLDRPAYHRATELDDAAQAELSPPAN